MLFNSIEFLVFLPLVFLLYWFGFKKLLLQNLLVVIVSYIFYGWWDCRFLVLIAFTSLCSWYSGVLISRYRNKRYIGRSIAAANIIINLGVLGVFKYFNFFADNLGLLFSEIGWNVDMPTVRLILPVGISFYTFQALSYTIDVYRQKIEPTLNVVAFFAFISFFPQLVAGPIERATNLLPQFLKDRQFDYNKAVDGMRQILWGLFKKMVVADNCAPVVNTIFSDYQQYNATTLLLGGVLFSFQIYGDFSGYSDIAIGAARLFGINLRRNFNFPYFSRSIAEFWRRWHISLNTWFVDYVYIPLGGSRRGKLVTLRNTFVIFLLSGLWHGANWTFVCWGLFHALCFIPLMLLGLNRKFTDTVAVGKYIPNIEEICEMLTTFVLAMIGWIFFRAESISMAYHYIVDMVSMQDGKYVLPVSSLLFIMILVLAEWNQREKQHALQDVFSHHIYLRRFLYLTIVMIILCKSGEHSNFIYFQF